MDFEIVSPLLNLSRDAFGGANATHDPHEDFISSTEGHPETILAKPSPVAVVPPGHRTSVNLCCLTSSTQRFDR